MNESLSYLFLQNNFMHEVIRLIDRFDPFAVLGICHIHGVSIKTKPGCLYHIYLMPDRIILKLSRYLEK